MFPFFSWEQRFGVQKDGRTPDYQSTTVCLQVHLSPDVFTALLAKSSPSKVRISSLGSRHWNFEALGDFHMVKNDG